MLCQSGSSHYFFHVRTFRDTFVILLVTGLHSTAAQLSALKSPDGRIEASIELPSPAAEEAPRWSARFRGSPLVSGQLGLQTKAEGDLLAGARLVLEHRRSVDEHIPVPFGRAAQASDRFKEVRLTLETREHRRIEVFFRAYNDAVAFRYVLLSQKDKASNAVISDELTSFELQGDPTAYAQYLENYNTSHEHAVNPSRYSELPARQLLDLPLTFSWPNGTYAAITEAALRHYAGMSLARSDEGAKEQLMCKLTPRPDGSKVAGPLPLQTPWRLVLIGDRPGALLESETVFCLNEPSLLTDTSWIKPGKITFHWWNGNVYDGKPGPPMLSFEMNRKYIEFCASNGIATHSITSTEEPIFPWYFQSNQGVGPGPDTDVSRSRADFPLSAIHRYAQEKHVRLWTWVHQAALRGRVEEAFAAFEKMGWSGMMVDFFDHDDQDSVEHAEAILAAAARHHIMIHFHGVWKPTGCERTFPNLMNHEGALNLEYLKWSNRCTPEHSLLLAFTRLVAGPMDYHLGGFRAMPRSEFKPEFVAPTVLGTRCHQLAMYVCFDNPNPMLADYPTAYENQPGFDFLKLVPTFWDETRVLVGEIGQVLVTARRKGKAWYIGGLSALQPRQLSLPLNFLGHGVYRARIWRDSAESEANPNTLENETRTLTAKDKLIMRVAFDGGFVAELRPATN